ncbi:glycosyltransferase [Modestobacter sp. VKM Ac-2979]|uniref:glycosyltransferase family 2 protein n=1 Tax=unclassified Modestobacter TaxID=2643866 RepID=UPI0022AB803B|nr:MULTISPECIES: glycosyltransferase [unclassified Modestobacter]MCZ2810479.1 glycosyltransferase [Modestobacter sp. VKM Ac-2979]MCZ2841965.1 glycosyltransferase [Modestobacter sp. VKM Ac-2980]
MSTAAPRTVTIGVLTFRRPADLAALLPMLAEQVARAAATGHRAEVLVVDNDPAGSGRAVVAAAGCPVVRYVLEPEPGIAAARNRVLAESHDRDVLVFIDDDERPRDDWLAQLLGTHRRTGAAAVAGAVVSDFSGPVDPWLVEGGFFVRRRLPTGTPIDVAATNNLLLDLRQLRPTGLRFDVAFGASGGEDTLFTRGIAQRGLTMVWCDEAVVTDVVPVDRATRSWVLRRAFSSGNSVSRVHLALAGSAAARLRVRLSCTGRGLPRLTAGLGRWALGAVTGSVRHRARGLRTAARGAGMVAGAAGHVYQEYGRPGPV